LIGEHVYAKLLRLVVIVVLGVASSHDGGFVETRAVCIANDGSRRLEF
jgi:hypothetical protein